jgi:hypothetical protein
MAKWESNVEWFGKQPLFLVKHGFLCNDCWIVAASGASYPTDFFSEVTIIPPKKRSYVFFWTIMLLDFIVLLCPISPIFLVLISTTNLPALHH